MNEIFCPREYLEACDREWIFSGQIIFERSNGAEIQHPTHHPITIGELLKQPFDGVEGKLSLPEPRHKTVYHSPALEQQVAA